MKMVGLMVHMKYWCQTMDFDHAQFLWCTNWCKEKGLSPYDATNWADAKAEYLKAQGDK